MSKQEQSKFVNQQLQTGLDAAYQNMLAFKRYKKTPVVIVRNGQVMEVSPDELPPVTQNAA